MGANFSYTIDLDVNDRKVLKALKNINTTIDTIEKDQILIDFKYNHDIEGFNKKLREISNSVPELGIQFQYDMNKKALLKTKDSVKEMEELKLYMDTNTTEEYVQKLISDISELAQKAKKGIIDETELIAPYQKLQNIIETINSNGGEVNLAKIDSQIIEMFEGLKSIDNILNSSAPTSLFNLNELENEKKMISELEIVLNKLRADGAVDLSEGGNKELNELTERMKLLDDEMKSVQYRMNNLNGKGFDGATISAKNLSVELTNILSAMDKIKNITNKKPINEDDLIIHFGDTSKVGTNDWVRSDRLGRLPEVLSNDLGAFSGLFYQKDFDPPASGESMSTGRKIPYYYMLDKSKMKDLNQLSFETSDKSDLAQDEAQNAEEAAIQYLKRLNGFIVATSTDFKDFDDYEIVKDRTINDLYNTLVEVIPNSNITLEKFSEFIENSREKMRKMGSVTDDLSFSNNEFGNDELPSDTLLQMLGYTGFDPIKGGWNDGSGVGGVIFHPEKYISNNNKSEEYVKTVESVEEMNSWIENITSYVQESNQKISPALNEIQQGFDEIYNSIKRVVSAISGLPKSLPDMEKINTPLKKLKDYINNNGGDTRSIFSSLFNDDGSINNANKELHSILNELGLIDKETKLMEGGNVNSGGIIGSNYTVKSTSIRHEVDDNNNDISEEKYQQRLAKAKDVQRRLQMIADEDTNIAKTIEIIEDSENKIFYELQTTAKGGIIDPLNYEETDLSFLKATDDQILRLIKDIKLLNDAGIYIDYDGANISYDEKTGFHLFDLGTYDARGEKGNYEEVFKNLFSPDSLGAYFYSSVPTERQDELKDIRRRAEEIFEKFQESVKNESEHSRGATRQVNAYSQTISDAIEEAKALKETINSAFDNNIINQWKSNFISAVDEMKLKIESSFESTNSNNEFYNVMKQWSEADAILREKRTGSYNSHGINTYSEQNANGELERKAYVNTKNNTISNSFLFDQFGSISYDIKNELKKSIKKDFGVENVGDVYDATLHSHPTKNEYVVDVDKIVREKSGSFSSILNEQILRYVRNLKINGINDDEVSREIYSFVNNTVNNLLDGENKINGNQLIHTIKSGIDNLLNNTFGIEQSINKENLSGIILKSLRESIKKDNILDYKKLSNQAIGSDLAFSVGDIDSYYQEMLNDGIKKTMIESNGMINELDLSSLPKKLIEKIVEDYEDGVETYLSEHEKEFLYKDKNGVGVTDFNKRSEYANKELSYVIKTNIEKYNRDNNTSFSSDSSEYLTQYSIESLKTSRQEIERESLDVKNLITLLSKLSSSLDEINNKEIKIGFETKDIEKINNYLDELVSTLNNIKENMPSGDINPFNFNKDNVVMIEKLKEVFNKDIFENLDITNLFNEIIESLKSLKSIISDIGDGEEFSPLMKILNQLNESISMLVSSIGSIDDGKFRSVTHSLDLINNKVGKSQFNINVKEDNSLESKQIDEKERQMLERNLKIWMDRYSSILSAFKNIENPFSVLSKNDSIRNEFGNLEKIQSLFSKFAITDLKDPYEQIKRIITAINLFKKVYDEQGIDLKESLNIDAELENTYSKINKLMAKANDNSLSNEDLNELNLLREKASELEQLHPGKPFIELGEALAKLPKNISMDTVNSNLREIRDIKSGGGNSEEKTKSLLDEINSHNEKVDKAEQKDDFDKYSKLSESFIKISEKLDSVSNELIKISGQFETNISFFDNMIKSFNLASIELLHVSEMLSSISDSLSAKKLDTSDAYNDNNLSDSNLLSFEEKAQRLVDIINKFNTGFNISDKSLSNLLEGAIDNKENSQKALELCEALEALDSRLTTHFRLIKDGNLNVGGIVGISDDNNNGITIIAKTMDELEEIQNVAPALEKAKEQGANVGKVLHTIVDDERNIIYQFQETMSGTGVKTSNDYLKATDEQILKLLSDIDILNKNGIYIDLNGDNILFDEEKGFSFIDLSVNEGWQANNENIIRYFSKLPNIADSFNESLLRCIDSKKRLMQTGENEINNVRYNPSRQELEGGYVTYENLPDDELDLFINDMIKMDDVTQESIDKAERFIQSLNLEKKCLDSVAIAFERYSRSGDYLELNNDLFNVLTNSTRVANKALENYYSSIQQVRDYVSKSKIYYDPNFSSEFGNGWQRILSTIGSTVLKKSTGDSSENKQSVLSFLNEMNGVLGTSIGANAINDQDALRQLWQFLDKTSDKAKETQKEIIKSFVSSNINIGDAIKLSTSSGDINIEDSIAKTDESFNKIMGSIAQIGIETEFVLKKEIELLDSIIDKVDTLTNKIKNISGKSFNVNLNIPEEIKTDGKSKNKKSNGNNNNGNNDEIDWDLVNALNDADESIAYEKERERQRKEAERFKVKGEKQTKNETRKYVEGRISEYNNFLSSYKEAKAIELTTPNILSEDQKDIISNFENKDKEFQKELEFYQQETRFVSDVNEALTRRLELEDEIESAVSEIIKRRQTEYALESAAINKQLEKEFDELNKKQVEKVESFINEQLNWRRNEKKSSDLEERRRAYDKLTSAIERYSTVQLRIANNNPLEGDVEEAKKLEDEILKLQHNPILTDKQIDDSNKKLDKLLNRLVDIENTPKKDKFELNKNNIIDYYNTAIEKAEEYKNTQYELIEAIKKYNDERTDDNLKNLVLLRDKNLTAKSAYKDASKVLDKDEARALLNNEQQTELYKNKAITDNNKDIIKNLQDAKIKQAELNVVTKEYLKLIHSIGKDDFNLDYFDKIREEFNSFSPEERNLGLSNYFDGIESQFDATINKLNSYSISDKWTNSFKRNAKNLSREFIDLKQKFKDGLFSENGVDEKALQDAINGLEKLNIKYSEFRSLSKDQSNLSATASSLSSLSKNISSVLEKNTNMSRDLESRFKALDNQVQKLIQSGNYSKKTVDELKVSFDKLNKEMIDTGQSGQNMFSRITTRLQDMNSKFIAQYMSIQDWIRYIREAATTIRELDDALTEMRKVSDESLDSLLSYQKTTFDVANSVGTTALELQQSTADWMRLGESLADASESAKDATILLNVSEFESIDEATSSLVAMSQAYKDLSKMDIIDVLNNVGNNYSIATDELSTALQASASALATQGNDLYEAVALITAGNAVVQDADKVGTGIRTISLRIAGTEEAKEELSELGEDVEDYVVSTSAKKQKIIQDYTSVASNGGKGVNILDDNGNLKNTYEILQEIADVYAEIQAEDKKYGTNRAQGLIEELAGKNRSNIAASILQNPEMLRSVYESSQNSQGSAEEELNKYLESISGKIAKFQNQLQEFESAILSSDLVKFVIDGATSILSILTDITNSLGGVTTAVLALTGAFAVSSFIKNRESKKDTLSDIRDAVVEKKDEIEEEPFIDSTVNQTTATMGEASATETLNTALAEELALKEQIAAQNAVNNVEYLDDGIEYIDNADDIGDFIEDLKDAEEKPRKKDDKEQAFVNLKELQNKNHIGEYKPYTEEEKDDAAKELAKLNKKREEALNPPKPKEFINDEDLWTEHIKMQEEAYEELGETVGKTNTVLKGVDLSDPWNEFDVDTSYVNYVDEMQEALDELGKSSIDTVESIAEIEDVFHGFDLGEPVDNLNDLTARFGEVGEFKGINEDAIDSFKKLADSMKETSDVTEDVSDVVEEIDTSYVDFAESIGTVTEANALNTASEIAETDAIVAEDAARGALITEQATGVAGDIAETTSSKVNAAATDEETNAINRQNVAREISLKEQGANIVADTTEAATSKIKSLAENGKGIVTSVWTAIASGAKKVASVIVYLFSNPITAAITVITIALSAAFVLWKKVFSPEAIDKATDKIISKVKELNDAFEESKQELEDYKDRLDEINDRISEINSQGMISITDSEELKTLTKERIELERIQALKDAQNKSDSEDAVKEVVDNRKSKFGKFGEFLNKWTFGLFNNESKLTRDFENDISNYKFTQDPEKGVAYWKEMVAIAEEYHGINSDEYEYDKAMLDDIVQQEKESRNAILKDIEHLQTERQSFINYVNTNLGGDFNALEDEAKSTFDEINSQLNEAYKTIYSNSEYDDLVIKPIFDVASLEEDVDIAESDLISYFAKGGTIDNLTKEFGSNTVNAISNACTEAGLIYKDFVNDIYSNYESQVAPLYEKYSYEDNGYDERGIRKEKGFGSFDEFIKQVSSSEDYAVIMTDEFSNAINELGNEFGRANITVEQANEVLEKLKEQIVDNTIALDDAIEKVTSLQEEFSTIEDVITDVTKVTSDEYKALLQKSSKYASALKVENGRLVVNQSRLRMVAKARQMDTKAQLQETIQTKKQQLALQLANTTLNIFDDTLDESISKKYDDINALQQEIMQYEALAESMNGCADALDAFKTAQGTNDTEDYDTTRDAYNLMYETINGYAPGGKFDKDNVSANWQQYNTDDFQTAAYLLFSKKDYVDLMNATNMEEFQTVANRAMKTLEPLMDKDNANSAAAMWKKVGKIIDEGEDIPKDDQEWAERLGVSEEVWNTSKQLGNLYGYNGYERYEETYDNNVADLISKRLQLAEANNTLAETEKALSENPDGEWETKDREKAANEQRQALDKYNRTIKNYSEDFTENFDEYLNATGAKQDLKMDEFLGNKDYSEDDQLARYTASKMRINDLEEAYKASSKAMMETRMKQAGVYDEYIKLTEAVEATKDVFEPKEESKYAAAENSRIQAQQRRYQALSNQLTQLRKQRSEATSEDEIAQLDEQITSVYDNIMALKEAGLINIDFSTNVDLIETKIEKLKQGLNQVETGEKQVEIKGATNADWRAGSQGLTKQNVELTYNKQIKNLEKSLNGEDVELDTSAKVSEVDTTAVEPVEVKGKLVVEEADTSGVETGTVSGNSVSGNTVTPSYGSVSGNSTAETPVTLIPDYTPIENMDGTANVLLNPDTSVLQGMPATANTILNVDKSPLHGLKTTADVTLRVMNAGIFNMGTVNANASGTAHAIGSAFANGTGNNWELKQDEQGSLVGELGTEGLVRDGRFYLIGQHGAERRDLKKGDIIFNHKQTEDLMKDGSISGRGKLIGGAFANGSVDGISISSAHASTNIKEVPGKSSYATFINSNADAIKTVAEGAKAAAKDVTDEVEKDSDETKDKFEQIIDWIERRVKDLSELFERWSKQAQQSISNLNIGSYYTDAAENLTGLLDTYGQAIGRYKQEAVAQGKGLSQEYIDKIEHGLIDIETITDETLNDQISGYQEWYDKAVSSMDSYIETAEKLYNLPMDEAAEKIDLVSQSISLLTSRIDNAITYARKGNLLLEQMDKERESLLIQEEATVKTLANLNNSKQYVLKEPSFTEEQQAVNKAMMAQWKEISLDGYEAGTAAYNAIILYNTALQNHVEAVNLAKTAEEEYISTLTDLAEKYYNLPIDKAEEKAEKFNNQLSLLGKQFDNATGKYKKLGNILRSEAGLQNKVLKTSLTAEKEANANYKSAKKTVSKDSLLNADDGISANEKKKIEKAIKDREKINTAYYKNDSKGLEAAIKYNAALKSSEEATLSARNAEEDYASSLRETYDKLYSLPLDELNEKTEKFSNSLTLLGKKLDNAIGKYKQQGELILGQMKDQLSILKLNYKYQSQTKSNLKSAKKDVLKNKNLLNDSGLSNSEIEKIRTSVENGKKINLDYYNDKESSGYKAAEAYNQALKDNEEAVQNVAVATEDYKSELRSLSEQYYNIPFDKAAEKVEKYNKAITLNDKIISNKVGYTESNNQLNYSAIDKLVKQNNEEQKKILNAELTKEDEAKANLKSAKKTVSNKNLLNADDGISDTERKKIQQSIKNGTKINLAYYKAGTKGYEAAQRYNAALEASKDATYDAQMAQEEFTAWEVEMAKTLFDNVVTSYDQKIKLLGYSVSDIDRRIAEVQAKGATLSGEYYKQQKKIVEQENKTAKNELEKMYERLSNIKEGTDEYYSALDEIESKKKEISDNQVELYNLTKQITDLLIEAFENIRSQLDRVANENSFIAGLLRGEDTDKKTGSFTDKGIAGLGTSYANAEIYRQKAQMGAERVDTLRMMKDKGILSYGDYTFNSIEELETQLNSFYDEWQSDIKATYDAENEIINLMKEAYQAEYDMYSELVDKRKEALQAEKDLHNYQKQISEKTKNITSLQSQISAYSGDNSQEALAKMQKLNAELIKAQDELQETEWEHALDEQQKMLDNMMDEYSELLEEKFKHQDELLEEGNRYAEANKEKVAELYNKVSEQTGYQEQYAGEFSSDGTINKNIQTMTDIMLSEQAERKAEADKKAKDEKASGDVIEAINKLGNITVDSQDTIDKVLKAYNSLTEDQKKLVGEDTYAKIAEAYGKLSQAQKEADEKKTAEENKKKAEADAKNVEDAAKKQAEANAKKAAENSANAQAEYEKAQDVQTFMSSKSGSTSKLIDNAESSKAIEYILAKASKAKKKKSEYTDINKAIYTYTNGKVLSASELKQLAKMLGVEYSTSKSGDLYKKLKSFDLKGFANGGIIKLLNDKIKKNGDDALASVKSGEAILTPVQTEMFGNLVSHLDDITQTMDVLKGISNLPEIDTNSIGNTIDYGGVSFNFELPNVVDSKTFISAIQSDTKLQKAIQSVSVDRLNGGSKLSVKSIR